jgi:hypothetical protein
MTLHVLTDRIRTSRQLGDRYGEQRNQVSCSHLRGSKFLRNRSFHRLQKLPRFAQQGLNPPSFGYRFPGEQAVLAGVLVCPWRAGSRRAAVHAAALFAAHRRRAAQAAGAGPGAATRAGQHRAGIAGVTSHAQASRLASTGSCSRSERPGMATLRAAVTAVAGFLSETITLACCVTLPTMALPPS